MTIKELYEWALQKGVEDYNLSVYYRDGRVRSYSYEEISCCCEIDIDNERKEVIL